MASNENDGVETTDKEATGVFSTDCEAVPGPSGFNSSPNMPKSPEIL